MGTLINKNGRLIEGIIRSYLISHGDNDVLDMKFVRNMINTIYDVILNEYKEIYEKDIKEELYNYLKFTLKRDKTNTYVKVIGNNIVSCLWLIDIMPYDPKTVYECEYFILDKLIYTYDEEKNV